MTKLFLRSSRLVVVASLIVSLAAGLLCEATRAEDRSAVKSFRVPAAAFSPIGRVYSLGEISINGHAACGEQSLWNGDELEVSERATARVSVESVGTVSLAHTTSARLAVCSTRLDDGTESFGLILVLKTGAASVGLLEGATAYLEAGECAFAATRGSSFLTKIRAGRAVIDVLRGKVDVVESSPLTRDYEVEMFKYDSAKKTPTGPPLPVKAPRKNKPGEKDKLAAKSSYKDDGRIGMNATGNVVRVSLARQPDLQVDKQPSGKNPGADRTIRFELDKPNVGTLVSAGGNRGQIVFGKTDPQGYALVTFEALHEGSTTFTVSDVTPELTPGERRNDWNTTYVVKKGFFQKWRNRAFLGGAAAALITTIVFKHPRPLRQQGPPQIP